MDKESESVGWAFRAAGLAAPEVMTFSVTGSCNVRCVHCWVGAGTPRSFGHVSTKTLFRIVDEFVGMGGRGVRITGGEPLCHPDWREILQYVSGKQFETVMLQTNAMLIGDREARVLRALNCPGLALQVSLDGATAATHDYVRGTGAYAGVMAGLQRLVDGGLGRTVSLAFTEMRHNISEFPELLERADSMGIGSVVAGTLVAFGRGADERFVVPPLSGQYLELMQRYESDARFRELYARIGRMAALEWRLDGEARDIGCTFAAHPYLTPAGRLYPCLMCQADDYAVDGVLDKGLAQSMIEGISLWSALAEISRRRRGIPECRNCPGKLVCAGGCMGRAWGSCGDLTVVDDRCGIRRILYQRFKSATSED